MKRVNIIDTLFIGIFSMYQKAEDRILEPKSTSVALLSSIFLVNLFILNNLCELLFNNGLFIFLLNHTYKYIYLEGFIFQLCNILIVYLIYIKNRRYRLLVNIFSKYDEKRQKKIKRNIIIYFIFLIALFFYSFFWIKPGRFHKVNTTKSSVSKMIQKESSEQNSIKLYNPFSNKSDTIMK